MVAKSKKINKKSNYTSSSAKTSITKNEEQKSNNSITVESENSSNPNLNEVRDQKQEDITNNARNVETEDKREESPSGKNALNAINIIKLPDEEEDFRLFNTTTCSSSTGNESDVYKLAEDGSIAGYDDAGCCKLPAFCKPFMIATTRTWSIDDDSLQGRYDTYDETFKQLMIKKQEKVTKEEIEETDIQMKNEIELPRNPKKNASDASEEVEAKEVKDKEETITSSLNNDEIDQPEAFLPISRGAPSNTKDKKEANCKSDDRLPEEEKKSDVKDDDSVNKTPTLSFSNDENNVIKGKDEQKIVEDKKQAKKIKSTKKKKQKNIIF